MCFAPDDTWQLSPSKFGSLDSGLRGKIIDINIHPISFRTAPEIFKNTIAIVSRGGIYKIKIHAEMLQNTLARVSRGEIY